MSDMSSEYNGEDSASEAYARMHLYCQQEVERLQSGLAEIQPSYVALSAAYAALAKRWNQAPHDVDCSGKKEHYTSAELLGCNCWKAAPFEEKGSDGQRNG